MDAVITEKIADIETLKKVEANLKEGIAKLQVIFNNLDAQAHTAQVKEERDVKLQDLEQMTKYAVKEKEIEIKRIDAERRMDMAETIERKVNDREKEIERREQKLLDLEDKIADLNSQRSNFEMYKVGIENKLAEAKETIAQANEAFAKIANDKDMLLGREIKIKEQEKYWNDCIGLLEEEQKKFQLEKENFIGLGKPIKEVVNA